MIYTSSYKEAGNSNFDVISISKDKGEDASFVGDAYLDLAYEQDGIQEVISDSFSVHNQYLQTWMELGPIAMILLIFIVLSAPYFHSGKARWTCLYLCLIYGMSMLTECYISRMSGVFQICFAAILLIAMEQEDDRPKLIS